VLLADTVVSWQAPSGLTTRAQDAPNVPFYVALIKEVELRMAERIAASEERISNQVQRAFSCPKMQICLTLYADLAAVNSTVANPVATPQLAIPLAQSTYRRVESRGTTPASQR
jgi:hypothetical protein